MFKSTSSQGDLNGFLDGGSRMNGELRFEDTFRIDGHFQGTIDASGDLIVGEGGEVDAEIKARRVYISGTVRGAVTAIERLEVTSIGKVYAALKTPSLSIEDGAFFEGSCSMEPPKAAAHGGSKDNKVTKMPVAASSDR